MQVHPSQGASGADDLFATETMAELCARQGRFGDAVAIYLRLLGGAVDPDKSARWQARLEELQRAPLVAAAPSQKQPAAVAMPCTAAIIGCGRSTICNIILLHIVMMCWK